MGLLDALRDPQFRRDVKTNARNLGQSASNTIASNISAPVDLIALALRKAGIPVPEPVGGSQWMTEQGLTRDVPQGAPKLAGETLGFLAPLASTKEGAAAIARGLNQMAANAAAPRAMNPQTGAIVWHGSPHKFDKFDSSKIGTGEGAQAYGHGLYLADSPATAQFYATKGAAGGAMPTPPKPTDFMVGNERFFKEGDKLLKQVGNSLVKIPVDKTGYGRALRTAQDNFDAANAAGNMYKVDLPDEQIARMLDWDKPLSQQPENIKAWLADPYNPYKAKLLAKDVGGNEPSGGLVMNRLQELMSEGKKANVFTNQANFGSANASRELGDFGIPGIRYLDAGSRDVGQGTRNFVVFPGNEDILRILERNGQVLP